MNLPSPRQQQAFRRTAALCAGLVVAMVGLAYAAVPLYNLFCRVTGFDGTPIVRREAADRLLDRAVAIRFDSNVAPGLNWSFVPEASEVEARLGETKTVFYRVRNEGRAPAAGIATFNVQPGQAGAFFVKMECFCFKEQTLQPGEVMDFPVVFYIDPDLAKDPNLNRLSAITLSYTYFAAKNGEPVAAASAEAKPKL